MISLHIGMLFHFRKARTVLVILRVRDDAREHSHVRQLGGLGVAPVREVWVAAGPPDGDEY